MQNKIGSSAGDEVDATKLTLLNPYVIAVGTFAFATSAVAGTAVAIYKEVCKILYIKFSLIIAVSKSEPNHPKVTRELQMMGPSLRLKNGNQKP